MRWLRIIAGALAWTTLIVAGTWWIESAAFSDHGQGRGVVGDLFEYATASRPVVTLQLDAPHTIAVGDPIFVIEGPDSVRQVGEIRRLDPDGTSAAERRAVVNRAEALLYSTAPRWADEAAVSYYTTPDSLDWVLQTMLPPEKRQQIAAEISETYQAHHAEIVRALKPVVVAGLRDAMVVVKQDLKQAVTRRRPELEQLGSRYQQQVVDQEIVPLVQQEIWPIVRRHAEPLATDIGQQIWQQASVWRFGWRYVYDKSPLPERRLTRKEWDRFVTDEAVPVLASHTADMVDVQQQILADVARNPTVRAAVRRNLSRIIDDPEFRTIIWEILREVFVDNPRLRETLEARWRSAEAQQAMQLTAARVEPSVRRIGDLLFGSQEEGITPEFARVLRNQILAKDRRWFLIEAPSPGTLKQQTADAPVVLRVRTGGQSDVHPFVIDR